MTATNGSTPTPPTIDELREQAKIDRAAAAALAEARHESALYAVTEIRRLRDEVERLRNRNGALELAVAGQPMRPSKKIVSEWFEAREVIVAFLHKHCPTASRAELEHNAAALIARLASHEPPILLEMQG